MTRLAPIALILLLCTCNLERVEDPTGNCANPPTAAFTPDRLSGNAPLTVAFNNTSAGAATYLWTFSLGATSTQVSPSHTFTAAGNYTVTLVAISTSGCKDTAMVSIVVNPSGPVPVAGFSITNAGCFAPCDVIFTNTSTDATSFEWDFGDGSPTVTQGNPTHRYELPGDYIVKLTAFGPGGSDIETKTVLVRPYTFQKTFGGASVEEGFSVQQTADGGYIMLGYTNSEGAGGADLYLVKANIAGELSWSRTYGGVNNDYGHSVQQTADGGYILAGYTNSTGAGASDAYLVKTNSVGVVVWDRTFGGVNEDRAFSVRQTTDGGYIVLGYTESSGAGVRAVHLIKVNSSGNMVWEKTFGGAMEDEGSAVFQTADGGYILFGATTSEGAGNYDMLLIKTDNLGNLVWKKTYGGGDAEIGFSVVQTSDAGYILLGYTLSFGAGGFDHYLIKTDNVGTMNWSQTFGGAGQDTGRSVHQTPDGGYMLFGTTYSEGMGSGDFHLIKTNSLGDKIWSKTFGEPGIDVGRSAQQTSDGGFILFGFQQNATTGNRDFYLVKTDKDGNL